MDTRSQNFAKYWRNSLADATFTKGGLNKKDTESMIFCSKEFLTSGKLDEKKTKDLFKNESSDCNVIEIILRPIVYHQITEHCFGKFNETPEYLVPISTAAFLARDGRCYPKSGSTFISRDILKPLVNGSYAIGSMYDLDIYLSTYSISGINYNEFEDGDLKLRDEKYFDAWKKYCSHIDLLLNTVAKKWVKDNRSYERLDHSFIIKQDLVKNAAIHIFPLYEQLRNSSKSIPLFERYASITSPPQQPCLESNSFFSKRLAHSSNSFPLAQAQRDALNHLLNAETGEILAVNGPPGTGKTTLLLSVVASLWATRALEGSEPPIIIAASTNNQAVTNIIDAFGKDFSKGEGPFSGRWLPNIDSFGAYFPAKSKSLQAEKNFQTEKFFNQVEDTEYFKKAKYFYIECAAKAFQNLESKNTTIEDVVKRLHKEILWKTKQLKCLEESWNALYNIRLQVHQELGNNPYEKLALYEYQEKILNEKIKLWSNIRSKWEQFQAEENIWYQVFSWIPFVAKKRMLKAKMYLADVWDKEDQFQFKTLISISEYIENKEVSVSKSIFENERILKIIKNLLQNLETCLAKWKIALAPLHITKNSEKVTLNQADIEADTKIRFDIFLLTTHYWEGRWLLEMEDLLPNLEKWNKKNAESAIIKRWNLRMKLTPCVVSTFYVLPNHFIYAGTGYVKDYLYNLADLLIVDEAGQVLPEVAGASFSLSKKALVIGDTHQIEPIWAVSPKVDVGNFLEAKLLNSDNVEDEYEKLTDLGKTASSGSVMKIAQNASRYRYDPDLEPGMYLYEHRRCYNEIIGYCNELVYKGKLLPKRGISPKESHFPALGYLHIDGICQDSGSGSRYNLLEARVIANWLIENKQKLEQKYNQPLNEIVGIITPFGAQVNEIKRAIRNSKANVNVDKGEDHLTIGTVHSFQGAERKLIIFSAVYSKHVDGTFIDNAPSMLNVAVSRAKDSFLVFGDMDIYNPQLKTPRGILARYLFSCEKNSLCFEYLERKDLLESESVSFQVLINLNEHDSFLKNVINNAVKEIYIVSPWFSINAVNNSNILPFMESVIQKKGIKISIYTDDELNLLGDNEEKKQFLFKLVNIGIDVYFVTKVHSKIVIKDEDLLCIGSFNWLSAQRKGNYVRHETSLVYQGKNKKLIDEINILKNSIMERSSSFNQTLN